LRIRLGTSGREVGGGDGPDHGTSGNLRNSLESGIPPPPSQAFRGTRAERTSAENSTMGKSAELESGARPMAPALLLQQSQRESSRAWKETVWRKRRGGNGAAEHRAMPAFAGARRLAPRFYEPGLRITVRLGVPKVRRVVDWVGSLGNGYQLCGSGTRGGIV
jgi:hypothetical protein